MANPLVQASYLLSAHLSHQLPPDVGREVAFAGRSNAGKSSALNAMTGRNGLARTSKTPGRTQQLVYFLCAPDTYLVDLPGYGYAKVGKDLRSHWLKFVNNWFQTRDALSGLVVVMDIRHPLREYDQQMLKYATVRGLPVHCLLTKADKISRSDQVITLGKVADALPPGATVQLFSATKKIGIDEARNTVVGWLGLDTSEPPAALDTQ
jgi:GTP-binding protein